MIRVVFDLSRTNWQSFGRVIFVELEEQAAAAAQAEAGADATITRLETRPARAGEYERWRDWMDRAARWKANVAAGIPNPRGLL